MRLYCTGEVSSAREERFVVVFVKPEASGVRSRATATPNLTPERVLPTVAAADPTPRVASSVPRPRRSRPCTRTR